MKKVLKSAATIIISALCCLAESCSYSTKVVDVDSYDTVELNNQDVDLRIIPIKCDFPMDALYRSVAIEDYIFMLNMSMSVIYCVQNDTVISVLNAKGRGRGEYSYISDFTYSSEEKILYVSTDDHRLLKYSVPDMNFVSMTDLSVTPLYMKRIDSDKMVMACSFVEENNIDVYSGICEVSSQTGKVLERKLKFSYINNKMLMPGDFISVPGGFILPVNSLTENRIVYYNTSDGSTEELFRFKFNSNWKVPKRLIKLAEKDKMLYAMEDYKETRHLEGAHYPDITPSGLTFWCFPRENNEARTVSVQVKDDQIIRRTYKISGTDIDPSPHFIQNGYCVEMFSSTDFDDERADELSPFGRELKRIADAQPFDNPVLLYFKVK